MAIEKPEFQFSTGAKGILSSGITNTYVYFKPFVDVGIVTDLFGIYTGYVRYINYQISDDNYNYRYIGFNEINFEINITAIKNTDLGIEYEYYIGESEYNRMEFIFYAGYDFKKVSLYGEFNFGFTDYIFNSIKIKEKNYNVYGELAYYVTDSTSFDLGYAHNIFLSTMLDSTYHKNIFRLGVMQGFLDSIYLLGGFNIGWDSNNYLLIGLDFGINFYLWKHLKITLIYMLSNNSALEETTESDLANANDSYLSHKFIFGLSFNFSVKNKKFMPGF